MTQFIINSNTTSVGINMSAGDEMFVSGVSAIAVDTTDVHGAIQISSGGVMSRTTLEDLATLIVSSGGSAVSGTADSTSEVLVQSGGLLSSFTDSGLLVLSQGSFGSQLDIGQGGVDVVNAVAVSGQVAAGGTQEIFLHGLDEFGTVAGVQEIFQGEASQDTILGGGLQEVGAQGVAEQEAVASGGTVVIDRFGSMFNSTVESGGTATVGGQSVEDHTAGSMTVIAGGLDTDSTILSGGRVTVSSGGESREGTVDAGGMLTVLSGGLADLNGVNGKEVVGSGGLDVSAFVSSGGLELVSGGVADSGVVESGGRLQVISGGVASGALISSGGRVVVGPGGLLINTSRVESGAVAVVSSGGVMSGGEIDPGATGTVSKGGLEAGVTVLGSVTVRGSTTSDFVINGASETVFGGGVGTFADVNESGTLTASSGAVLISTIVGSRGHEIVASGGVARFTTLEDGSEVVLSGGVASGTIVSASGTEVVSAGGLATLVRVSSGGTATVWAGGEISGANLTSGATLIDGGQVLLATRTLLGTLSGAGRITEIASHGVLTLSENGSAFGGVAAISAGRIELAVAGAIGSGGVLFLAASTASQTLQIDAAAAPAPGGAFANTLTNFSNDKKQIDLRSLAFSAGASATLSGTTLTLADGGKTYQFHLAGLLGKSFSVAADGSGGTEITAHNTAAFTQAAAVLTGSGATLLSPVSGYEGGSTSVFHAGMVGGRG